MIPEKTSSASFLQTCRPEDEKDKVSSQLDVQDLQYDRMLSLFKRASTMSLVLTDRENGFLHYMVALKNADTFELYEQKYALAKEMMPTLAALKKQVKHLRNEFRESYLASQSSEELSQLSEDFHRLYETYRDAKKIMDQAERIYDIEREVLGGKETSESERFLELKAEHTSARLEFAGILSKMMMESNSTNYISDQVLEDMIQSDDDEL